MDAAIARASRRSRGDWVQSRGAGQWWWIISAGGMISLCEFDFLWILGHLLVSAGLCGPAGAGSSQVKTSRPSAETGRKTLSRKGCT